MWQLAARSPMRATALGLMRDNFIVSLDAVTDGRVWTLLTSTISHIDPTHLFVNCLALWVFGVEVWRVVGTRGFLHVYVAGGIVASLGHVAYCALAGSSAGALGASGSVMAIAVIYAALFPKRTLLINFFLPVPAALAVAGYLVLDALGVFGGGDSRIAHAAHLGGALYGLGYYLIVVRPYIRRLRERASRSP